MDAVTISQKLQFVRGELAKFAGKKSAHGKFTLVLCPFHTEVTPSGRVYHSDDSRNPGYFRCYGCGKEAPWDEVAPALGLAPFKKGKPKDEFAALLGMGPVAVEDDTPYIKERIRFKAIPIDSTWRGFDYDMLMRLGAKLCRTYHEDYGWTSPKLYLPVIVNGEKVGYIKAQLKKEKGSTAPSYINAAGSWSKTHGLFPFDVAIKLMKKLGSSTVLLVEGPRDALKLISKGIPAICILGTQSWSAKKAKLLELAGVSRVVLMMDGDCAGIDATKLIKPTLKQMFEIKVIKLWSIKGSPYIPFAKEKHPSKAAKAAGVELWDPGNAPGWILKKIKEKYYD